MATFAPTTLTTHVTFSQQHGKSQQLPDLQTQRVPGSHTCLVPPSEAFDQLEGDLEDISFLAFNRSSARLPWLTPAILAIRRLLTIVFIETFMNISPDQGDSERFESLCYAPPISLSKVCTRKEDMQRVKKTQGARQAVTTIYGGGGNEGGNLQ